MLSEEKLRQLRQQYNPDGSQLRRAQLRLLDMLSFLDDICRAHGLLYWIDSGTLLGAVRHGGFIPWDDDADVCMPIADMLRLREIMLKDADRQPYALQCHETDAGHWQPWIALRDRRSFYLHHAAMLSEREKRFRGLQVDIFPIEKGIRQPLHRLASALNRHLLLRPVMQRHGYHWMRPFVPVAHQVLEHTVYPLFRKLRRSSDSAVYEKAYGIPFSSRHPEADIFPLATIGFEGRTFCCPCHPEAYLSAMYGDWQELPPSDDSRGHDVELMIYE